MDKKSYEKITVSDIAKKAGIARQTFYRNYTDKNDVLFEFFRNMLSADLLKIENVIKGEPDTIVLLFDYSYMHTQRERVKKILTCCNFETRIRRNLQQVLLHIIETFKDNLSSEDFVIFHHKLIYQLAGCFYVFFDWFINDSPTPVEHLVSMLNVINFPKTTQYHNIPNIMIRISEG
jgi:AcrR family transcriptional regulator